MLFRRLSRFPGERPGKGKAISSSRGPKPLGNKWIDEVNSLCQGVPVILVGLKKDIRDGNTEQTNTRKHERLVQTSQGADVAAQIGARRFIECSALSGENVNEVFDKATRAAMFVGAGGAVDSDSCCLIL